MNKQSFYLMLIPFRRKPFSFVINYQGIDVVVDFWVERIEQTSTQFNIVGTMFMKNGAELIGKIVTVVSTKNQYIKIKGDRHKYVFTPVQESLEYWNKFVAELKKIQ